VQDIVTGVQEALTGSNSSAECIFNINDVKTATARLKAHKGDGSSDFSLHHIVNAGNDLCVHVACLFTASPRSQSHKQNYMTDGAKYDLTGDLKSTWES
jgi:hypothetical protein